MKLISTDLGYICRGYICRRFWLRAILWGLAGCFIGMVAGIIVLRLTPPRHRVEMMIGPVAHQGATMMGAGAGLTIEAGMGNVRESRDEEIVSDYARFRQTLTGPMVARALLDQHPALAAHLMGLHPQAAPPYWQQPDGIMHRIGGWVRALAGRPGWVMPGALELGQIIKNRIEIRPVADTAMHRLVLYDSDPEQARLVLDHLYRLTEDMLRQEASRRLQIQIDYVTRQLGQVSQTSQREALGQLLGRFSQARTMLAVDLPFAADLVVPPLPAQERDPSIMMVLAVSGFLGLMGAVLLFCACTLAPQRHD